MGEMFTIRNLADIAEIEKVPLSERVKGSSTYELIERGAGDIHVACLPPQLAERVERLHHPVPMPDFPPQRERLLQTSGRAVEVAPP